MTLTDPKIPTAQLVTVVRHKGWVPVQHGVNHTTLLVPGTPQDYDAREAVKQKFYYMTLLQLDSCLPLSGGFIPSQHPVPFYRLLLRGVRTKAGLGNKHYARQWNSLKGVDVADLAPLEEPLAPPPLPLPDDESFYPDLPGVIVPKRKPRSSTPGGGGRGRGGGRGGGAAVPPPPIAAPEPLLDEPVVEPAAPEPGPADGGSDDEGFFPAPVAREEREKQSTKGPVVASIDGLEVVFDNYFSPAGKHEPNFVMFCQKHQGGYHKRRGCTERFEKEFGIIEPLAFLHCWHAVEWPTKPTIGSHPQENPSKEAVRAFAVAHAEELREVCRKCGR